MFYIGNLKIWDSSSIINFNSKNPIKKADFNQKDIAKIYSGRNTLIANTNNNHILIYSESQPTINLNYSNFTYNEQIIKLKKIKIINNNIYLQFNLNIVKNTDNVTILLELFNENKNNFDVKNYIVNIYTFDNKVGENLSMIETSWQSFNIHLCSDIQSCIRTITPLNKIGSMSLDKVIELKGNLNFIDNMLDKKKVRNESRNNLRINKSTEKNIIFPKNFENEIEDQIINRKNVKPISPSHYKIQTMYSIINNINKRNKSYSPTKNTCNNDYEAVSNFTKYNKGSQISLKIKRNVQNMNNIYTYTNYSPDDEDEEKQIINTPFVNNERNSTSKCKQVSELMYKSSTIDNTITPKNAKSNNNYIGRNYSIEDSKHSVEITSNNKKGLVSSKNCFEDNMSRHYPLEITKTDDMNYNNTGILENKESSSSFQQISISASDDRKTSTSDNIVYIKKSCTHNFKKRNKNNISGVIKIPSAVNLNNPLPTCDQPSLDNGPESNPSINPKNITLFTAQTPQNKKNNKSFILPGSINNDKNMLTTDESYKLQLIVSKTNH